MARSKTKHTAADLFPEAELAVNPTASSAFSGMAPEVEVVIKGLESTTDNISVDLLISNPFQPRKVFDEAKLQELAESIKEHGVIQRVVVRPSKTQENFYEIVAGERRWRASRLANKTTIPAEILTDCSDAKMRQIALIENIQRVDLTPIELAETYYSLISIVEENKPLYSIRSLAEKMGKNKSHVEDHLNLLKVPSDVRQLIIEDPKISLRIVSEIGSVSNPTDRADLIREVRRRDENKWNTQDVINLVKTLDQSAQVPPSSRATNAKKLQASTASNMVSEIDEEKPVDISSSVDSPSPALQLAKFKLAWEKNDKSIQSILKKVGDDQQSYTRDQKAIVQTCVEKWLHQLQDMDVRFFNEK